MKYIYPQCTDWLMNSLDRRHLIMVRSAHNKRFYIIED